MPVIAIINGTEEWLYPKANWGEFIYKDVIASFKIKGDFYVDSEEITEE